MKTAIAYGRVSGSGQEKNGRSLPTQLEAIRKYAQDNGFEIILELTDDCSGSIPVQDRPAGRRIYEMLNHVDAVILYTNDRASRDKRDFPVDFLIFLRDLQDANCELHFVDTGLADGGIVDLFKAWQAADERRKIRERTSRGRRAKAKAGLIVGAAQPAFGYEWQGQGRNGQLVIVENDARIVREIYAWYVDGLTLAQISDKLNKAGIPGPKADRYKDSSGLWHFNTIRRLIDNQDYIGIFSYSGIEIVKPDLAIVSRELWQAAQDRRTDNKRRPRHKTHDYLLSGIFSCSCGAAMCGEFARRKDGDRRFYRCKSRAYLSGHCGQSTIDADQVEHDVYWHILTLLREPERVIESALTQEQQRQEQIKPTVSRLENSKSAAAECESKMTNLVRELARATSDIVKSTIHKELERISREMSAWQDEAIRLQSEIDRSGGAASFVTDGIMDVGKIYQAMSHEQSFEFVKRINHIRGELTLADFDKKREWLERLQVRVSLQEDGRIRVSCNISPAVILGTEKRVF